MNTESDSSLPMRSQDIILMLREQRVVVDADLARIYGVQTRALNQAVKRNADRFPPEFSFELDRQEILRISQTVTSLRKLKFSKQVRVFTEHGALMAATVLNSPRAVRMSLFIIRAFVKMREEQAANAAILMLPGFVDDGHTALFQTVIYDSPSRNANSFLISASQSCHQSVDQIL